MVNNICRPFQPSAGMGVSTTGTCLKNMGPIDSSTNMKIRAGRPPMPPFRSPKIVSGGFLSVLNAPLFLENHWNFPIRTPLPPDHTTYQQA